MPIVRSLDYPIMVPQHIFRRDLSLGAIGLYSTLCFLDFDVGLEELLKDEIAHSFFKELIDKGIVIEVTEGNYVVS